MAGKKGMTPGGLTYKVAKLKAQGKSGSQIAKAVDRCPDTVSRILKTEEAQEILKLCHSRLIQKSARAIENIEHAVEDFQEAYDAGNKTKAGIAWDATKMVTQITGLSQEKPSTVHQTFINSQTNIIDPMIAELISKHLGSVIDIEPITSIPIEIGEGSAGSK